MDGPKKRNEPIEDGGCRFECGFSLVACMVLLVLLAGIGLGLASLSSLALRVSRHESHHRIARANARLALMQALADLQKHAGPDQRVTASAGLLETDSVVSNRHWLGVWKTTCQSGNAEWPTIGKAPVSGADGTPYGLRGAYTDLRDTIPTLRHGAWKDQLHLEWLVSRKSLRAFPRIPLDPENPDVIEMVGRGSLGAAMSQPDFEANRVLVERVRVGDQGAMAWFVADNNQKASLAPIVGEASVDAIWEAAPGFNPALIEAGGIAPLAGMKETWKLHGDRICTFGTLDLALGQTAGGRDMLDRNFHHFTFDSPGLFSNTATGGLRRDATPLLLAQPDDPTIDFLLGMDSGELRFSSSLPIIPGPEHGVLGPSFDALRDWATHAGGERADLETAVPDPALRVRPADDWPHAVSDGATFNVRSWSALYPKIFPIMTEVRWHYYFSHHNRRIRTHIIPRVCLWNPYNRALHTPELSVLMPNPYHGIPHGMHFFPEESHVDELKSSHQSEPSHVFSRWIRKSGYVGGPVYKMRTNPFPQERYLAFTLESTMLQAGECHVFSPKVTQAEESANGIRLQRYRPMVPSLNLLSSRCPQGADHYLFDPDPAVPYQVQTSGSGWSDLGTADLEQIDWSRIMDYQPELVMQTDGKVENFPFVLKFGSSGSLLDLHTRETFPTLQLVLGNASGVKPTSYFGYIGEQWGSANQQDNSFGYLQTFAEAPLKDAPDTHQVGAKMLWLDETVAEANAPPLRGSRWAPTHMVFNTAPIANWNVRAQLISRSPASQVGNKWYMNGAGSWLLQFVPLSPQDLNDQPSLSGSGSLVKNPFGSAVTFPFSPDVVLFDLPHPEHGVLSLGRLRHAMLSPYSWNPTYVVGHSLRDLHAPSQATAHDFATSGTSPELSCFGSHWDSLLGASRAVGVAHGSYSIASNSSDLLQIGKRPVQRDVLGHSYSSSEEILAFDIAYEVNQNLWDSYFLSGMPLSENGRFFGWDPAEGRHLHNPRYQFNHRGTLGIEDSLRHLSGESAMDFAFFRNAEILKNRSAFNINSLSVEAWTAFLAGNLGEARKLKSGLLDDDVVSFARFAKPFAAAATADTETTSAGAWQGARALHDDEVRNLAANIVSVVKSRGPFLSLADFVNRRLTAPSDPSSHMGVLDAAIEASGLNASFESDPRFVTSAENRSPGSDAPDNNHPGVIAGYRYVGTGENHESTQPRSQAWGVPGYLTQGDLLEPLAPSMTARGDTFTIRAYGESWEGRDVRARAWLEAIVERTPDYVESRDFDSGVPRGNRAVDAAHRLDHATGRYHDGGLSQINQRFGRRFVVQSFRWLVPQEV